MPVPVGVGPVRPGPTTRRSRTGSYGRAMPNTLLIVHVDVAVVPEQVDAFLAATKANATASRQEPGVVRFDVLSDRGDAGHVVLVEVYSRRAGRRRAQGHRALPRLARHRGADDGSAAAGHPVRQHLAGRRGLVER